MEAAALFTIAALRGVSAGALLTVSDLLADEHERISEDALRAGVESMAELALRAATSDR
jgi:5'-methylthioadenosine phosphorylase/purine-nucleoside phosphorylase